ncbi:hypothetical protein MSG28_012758 [Choristoneura fumiferana]|uniref:Uncharacterized protein n=1 Tax=Choristoneura fumiferana TaxID=7141 RepID=A0ACC0JHZ4_CHOFU|nr:hypothetical protein MSG28_012758 [Choristoneura fumiferana]
MLEPKNLGADDLESWVELNSGGGLAAENEYIRLLREAQRESRDSSVRHSRASSVKGRPEISGVIVTDGRATSLEEQITVGEEKSSSGHHKPEDEALAGLHQVD